VDGDHRWWKEGLDKRIAGLEERQRGAAKEKVTSWWQTQSGVAEAHQGPERWRDRNKRMAENVAGLRWLAKNKQGTCSYCSNSELSN
jgi:hypothetical protein